MPATAPEADVPGFGHDIGAGGVVGPIPFPATEAQAPLQSEHRSLTAEARVAQREGLLAELPADLRRELGSFERQVDWLSRYKFNCPTAL